MADDRPIISRRSFLQTTGGTAAVISLAGCLDDDVEVEEGDDDIDISDDDDDDEETPDDDDEETPDVDDDEDILLLLNGTMDTMDPIRAELADTNEVIRQVFDTPFHFPKGVLSLEGLLFEDYEIDDEFRTYTFHLKEGVQFHDGHGEVTADDLVYSWERLVGSPNSRRAHHALNDLAIVHETRTVEDDDGDEFEEYDPWSLAVEAIDDYTIEMTIADPYYAALEELTFRGFAPIPEGQVGDVEGYDGEVEHADIENEVVIGCGPFEFDYWESENQCEVSAFDDYHGGRPTIDGVHWQIMTDDSAIYNYSMNKNVDVPSVPTAQFDPDLVEIEETTDIGQEIGTYGPMRNDETANYFSVPALSTGFLTFNVERVEKAARQATAYVMDHEQIAADIYKERVEPAYFLCPPSVLPGGVEEYNRLVEEEYPYGPGSMIDEAREVMEEAGYSEDDPYEFQLHITDSAVNEQFAGLLRDQLAAAHIEIDIEVGPFATLVEQSNNGVIDCMIDGWGMGWDDPSSILQLLYPPHTHQDNPGNIIVTEWYDSEYADQAEEAWEAFQDHPAPSDEHEQARDEAFLEMEFANWEDVVFVGYEHRIYDRFWYDWVDIEPHGPTGGQKYTDVELGDRP